MAKILSQFKSFFGFAEAGFLGIDIGASSVKVVGIRGKGMNTPRLVAVGHEDTPLGCVVDGSIKDLGTLTEVVRNALSNAGITYCKNIQANIGLRGATNVVFKRLLLPQRNEDELREAIVLEAQQHVDNDLSNWTIDWQLVSPTDAQGQVAVMLVAARTSVAEDYIHLLESLNLKSTVFDCDVFAIENSFIQATGNDSEVVLLLDIGKDSTKFNLMQNNSPLVVRSLPLGGGHLTDSIARVLGVEYDLAENYKISACSSDEQIQPEVYNQIKIFIKEFCEEVKRTIEFFVNSNSESKIDTIDRVILSGGSATILGLSEALREILGGNVELANPFNRMNLGKFEKLLANYPHIYAVAAGLAMRFNGDKPT